MKETILNLFKRIITLLFSAIKGLVRMIVGEENEDKVKKLAFLALAGFLAICVAQSLLALSSAKRKAARKS